MTHYYPLMIDIRRKACIVIGGGNVAQRKILSLVESGAVVKVISPSVSSKIVDMEQENKVVVEYREYTKGDVKGYFLVVIATDSPALNQEIYQEINHDTQFVNVVDHPSLSTFIVPATVNRGHLQIAISTNGASPGLAKKIKEELEITYGNEYAQYTDFLAKLREIILNQEIDAPYRRALFNRLLDKDVLQKIIEGKREQLERDLMSMLEEIKT